MLPPLLKGSLLPSPQSRHLSLNRDSELELTTPGVRELAPAASEWQLAAVSLGESEERAAPKTWRRQAAALRKGKWLRSEENY